MGIQNKNRNQSGFTIVELIIIIIVIGILAAITIVSYNAVTKNAHGKAVSADLQTVGSQLQKAKSEKGSYPASSDFESQVTLSNTSNYTTYGYNFDNLADTFCLTATGKDNVSYYITSTNSQPTAGTCQTSASPVVVTNRMKDPSLTVLPTSNMTVTGVTGTPSIVTDSTAHSGSSYLRFAVTSAGASTINYSLNSTSIDSTLLPNTPYTLSGKIRPSKAIIFNARFSFTDSFGTVTTSPLTTINAPAGTWTTLHITGQSATPVTVRMTLANAAGQNWVSGDRLEVDSLMLTQGSTVYQYKDGASAGWSWNGTPNDSSSTGPALPESL